MVDIIVDKDKLVISFLPDLRIKTSRIEKGLVKEDLLVQRPVRNVIDTELDDIISEIKDFETSNPAKYEMLMKIIEEARLINNILKTIEEIRNDNIIEIYHELLSD